MSDSTRPPGPMGTSAETISFARRFAVSESFEAIFKEGMGLVERAAAYLDGEGRREARALKSPLNVIYATESMRLTTRLLEVASWLLIRRSLKAGEITPAEAARKRQRVKLRTLGRPSHIKSFAELPPGLQGLIEASFSLTDRVAALDRAIEADDGQDAAAAEPLNPVAGQIAQLRAAFSR